MKKMKKVLTIILALVMMLSTGLTVFAATGAFVSSPSGNKAPVLIEGKPISEGCTAELVITPYSEGNTLPENTLKLIERAYSEIVGTNDITSLNSDLAALAAAKKIPAANLAVSDLFDISDNESVNNENHDGYDFVISAETLDNFVGLLHFHGDKWELVEGARVEKVDGKDYLYFSVADLSPFAIVVNTNTTKPPKTGDIVAISIYVTLMVASAFTLVLVLVKRKKKNI